MYIKIPERVEKNSLKSFSPFRTKDERKKIDWDVVLGLVVSHIYRKKLNINSFDDFTKICEGKFKLSVGKNNKEFWRAIKEMYFDNQDVINISPEFLLFRASEGDNSTINTRLAEMFISMLGDTALIRAPESRLNFIERSIFECFNDNAVVNDTSLKVKNENLYLPYLSKKFVCDLRFLSSKPDYLFDNFKYLLKLYGFLYVSQLAHNLYYWSDGPAINRPNYFILDSETASKERRFIREFGCRHLLRNITYIFPYLNMAQFLQSPAKGESYRPIWQAVESLPEEEEFTNALNDFANKFVIDRNIKKVPKNSNSANDAITQLFDLSVAQFKTGNKDKDDINLNYVRAVKSHLCDDFIKLRGSAGATLVLNQDYMILLTNLAIGKDREKLRLHELLDELNVRGVYLDNQSQEELIKFYERIGNVERMSDSGDAVYVTKTV